MNRYVIEDETSGRYFIEAYDKMDAVKIYIKIYTELYGYEPDTHFINVSNYEEPEFVTEDNIEDFITANTPF